MRRNTRLSFNINLDYAGDFNKLIRYIRLWRPSGILVMGGATPAGLDTRLVTIRNAMSEWGGKTIVRLFQNQEQEYARTQKVGRVLDWLERNHLVGSGLYVNIGNEETPANEEEARRASDWYAEIGEQAIARGFTGVVLWNMAVGAIPREHIDAGAYDSYLEMLARNKNLKYVIGDQEYGRISMGIHDYTHASRRVGSGQPYNLLLDMDYMSTPNVPTWADINVEHGNNWLAGRYLWLYERMRDKFGVQNEVDVDFTEYDIDNIGNIYTVDPETARIVDGFVERGQLSVVDQNGNFMWRQKTAKGRVTLLQYYDQIAKHASQDLDKFDIICLEWANDERIFDEHVRSMCIFSYTFHTDHPFYWGSITNIAHPRVEPVIERWAQYKRELEDEWNQQDSGVPNMLEVPDKSMFWYHFEANSPFNFRESPAGRRIGKIQPGDNVFVVNHIPEQAILGKTNYDWIEVVNQGGQRGFMALLISENMRWSRLEPQPEMPEEFQENQEDERRIYIQLPEYLISVDQKNIAARWLRFSANMLRNLSNVLGEEPQAAIDMIDTLALAVESDNE